jgi:hypothetical protein
VNDEPLEAWLSPLRWGSFTWGRVNFAAQIPMQSTRSDRPKIRVVQQKPLEAMGAATGQYSMFKHIFFIPHNL